MLEDFVQDPEELPHLGGDGLTREAKGQRQDLFIELYRGQKRFTFTHINIQEQHLCSNSIHLMNLYYEALAHNKACLRWAECPRTNSIRLILCACESFCCQYTHAHTCHTYDGLLQDEANHLQANSFQLLSDLKRLYKVNGLGWS